MSKLTRIHVNQHNIKANAKGYGDYTLPVLTVKDYTENRKGFEAIIGDGVAKVVYRPDKPLPCGARVWIETRLDVQVS